MTKYVLNFHFFLNEDIRGKKIQWNFTSSLLWSHCEKNKNNERVYTLFTKLKAKEKMSCTKYKWQKNLCRGKHVIWQEASKVIVKKSDNLQYNDSSTKRLMFQVLFFFIISCKILCKNRFNLFSCFFFYNFTKIKIKSFECPKSIRNRPSVSYWRLSDF